MDNKLFVTIIVVALVIAGVSTAAFVYNAEDDTTDDTNMFNIIARANSEGSGLYIDSNLVVDAPGIPVRKSNSVPFFDNNWQVSEANKAAWGGLIFGTPGTSSIQHTQLAELASKMGLNFTLYSTNASVNSDTLYYDSGVTNAGQAISNTVINGGILWEPQYQLIIDDSKFQALALTNDVFADHTCCVIAGNTEYMKGHTNVTVKFLAGYIEAVDSVNEIMANRNTDVDAYNDFVSFVMTKVSALNDKPEITKKALENITYLYADDAQGDLDNLESDIAQLVKNLGDIGVFKKSVSNPELFAEEFVTQTYIKKAIDEDYTSGGNASIKVAVITGDIHQIAIHWGIHKGFFSDLGVTIDVVGSTNGAGVATALVNGEATFGFLGARPATITTINSGYITA